MKKYTIPAIITCPHCGSKKVLRSYCKMVTCDYCNSPLPFDGFKYQEFNPTSRMRIKGEMECPNCRSKHMLLSSNGKQWACIDCGYRIKHSELVKTVFWFCDNCDTFLNVQSGFNVDSGRWKCTNCGYDNDVTEDNILLIENVYHE